MNAIDPLPPEPQDKSKAPAVDGALDILEVLIRSTYPLSLSEIAERVGMPVVSCHRIVGALVRRELVVRDLLRRKSCGVGAKLFQTVSAVYFQQPVVSLFHSIADVLKNDLHEAVHLSIPAGYQALVVAHVSWPYGEPVGAYVGKSRVLHLDAADRAMMSMRPACAQKHYWEACVAGAAAAGEPPSIDLDGWLHDLEEIKRIG
ncbi:helix-turn-helix domain-containing protein [Burkholderia cenocepacia]|uniref:helix-turn-helix domain-containing protein n=1 Tax=Burkholderia cenocepacia TaxID=95486 RepID=UPI00406C0971